ncbi:hypothetical protein Xmau_00254 [Xenorhabdus mauleonii]|uniref:Uncharacterized protein n=2 Tax=Xenorhabdus mauleonii TaxID=351675 RepID=A0A1I3MW52_9GAMM|nr:hypothetical protein [Xenorhabdus mauleonii]PHM45863.1 hypothetical protein Xmau_00254 [Xenorhabdus mauleonii]SFJ01152.1 hypothetical protein SAMN05421680_1056 [Xenorhabdus mauleonii]
MGPIDGTYVSLDEKLSLEITNSNDHPGVFDGIFKHYSLELGNLIYANVSGEYRYVTQQTAFQIGFSAIISPAAVEYIITDHWNGVRTSDKSLIMSGLRTYVTNSGLYNIHHFDKIIFKMT